MTAMIIKRRWWDPIYPYSVKWSGAYELHYTQAGGGPLVGEPAQGPFYVMKSKVQHYLKDLPKARFLWVKRPACLYQYQTRRFGFRMLASNGKLVNPYPVPAILMARKSDALMLKLACGGL